MQVKRNTPPIYCPHQDFFHCFFGLIQTPSSPDHLPQRGLALVLAGIVKIILLLAGYGSLRTPRTPPALIAAVAVAIPLHTIIAILVVNSATHTVFAVVVLVVKEYGFVRVVVGVIVLR